MIETKTIIETIHYILKKIGSADKIKLVKLVYLADKYHLLLNGRTITNDDYYAMENGPVGSTVKDVLGFNGFALGEEGFQYACKLLEKFDDVNFKAKEVETKIEFNMLSESDIEALNFIIDKFGNMDTWDLVEFTHNYPEWSQYEELFKTTNTKRKRLEIEELLSTIDEDGFNISSEHIEIIREELKGICV